MIQGRIDEMAQLALKAWPDEPAQKSRQAGNKATGRESKFLMGSHWSRCRRTTPSSRTGTKIQSYLACRQPGVLNRREACARYRLCVEELASWETALDRNGIPGLRVTPLQIYRGTPLRKR